MPIIIKDFSWNQTESTVIIKIPIKSVTQSQTDVFTSRKYMKLSYKHYFFEIFLKYSIVPEESRCVFMNDSVELELKKETMKLWDDLEINLNRQEKQELKLKLIQEEYDEIQKRAQKSVEKTSELKRTAVTEQIRLDTKQRQLIEKIKETEKLKTLGNFAKSIGTSGISSGSTTTDTSIISPIPSPRNTVTLQVDFTPREFPTPLRDSQVEEEEEWLRKQAAARRSVGFISEDLRPEEKNPYYLKQKGDEFLKAGNYLGAISAYSFGIKLRDTFADLYVARAAAHLGQGIRNSRLSI